MGNQQNLGCCTNRIKDQNFSYQDLEKTMDQYLERKNKQKKAKQKQKDILVGVDWNEDTDEVINLLDDCGVDIEQINLEQQEEIDQAQKTIEEAKFNHQKGRFKDAINEYNKAINILRQYYSIKNEKVYFQLCNLAGLYREISDFKSSILIYQRVLQLLTDNHQIEYQELAEQNSNVIQILNNLALLNRDIDNHEKALSQLKTVQLLIEGGNNKANNVMQIQVNLNIGLCHFDKNQMQEAKRCFKQCLSQILGNDDYQVEEKEFEGLDAKQKQIAIDALNNIAIIYELEKDYETSEQYYQVTHELILQVYNEKHPQYSLVLNNMAGVFVNQQKYDLAMKYLKQSLEIRERVFGSNNINVAQTLNNIGGIHEATQQIDQAIQYYKQSSQIIKNIFGDKNALYILSLANIYRGYTKKGKLSLALNTCLEVYFLVSKHMSDQMELKIKVLLNLGWLQKQMNSYQEALETFLEIQQILENNKSAAHLHFCLFSILAEVYHLMGDQLNSSENYQKAIELKEQIPGQYKKQLASVYYNYALLLPESQKNEFMKMAIEIGTSVYGSEQHPFIQKCIQHIN